MHYTYILKLRNNNLYIGYTDNVERRIKEHQKVWKCELIYYEAYNSEKLARTRELRLKYYGSAWRGLKRRIQA